MQIKLENLNKTYAQKDGGTVKPVNGISLSIPENTVFGIIGKSGAGKSSLVRLMSLLEKPDSGQIFYDGREVQSLPQRELILERRKIGMIFQNFNLFSSRTAGKNVAYPLEIARVPKKEIEARVKELLALVGLEDKENAPISTLSGGQKQRVAIARALSVNPHILFCDEATSALDPQTTKSILNLIRDLQKKLRLTVVMITHQMEVVRDACDFVAVIDRGSVVEQGSVHDVFTNPAQQITRDFIKNISTSLDSADSAHDQTRTLRWGKTEGKYSLYFNGNATDEPLLSRVTRDFKVEVNILSAGIQQLTDGMVGTMTADFIGSDEEIRRAIAYLEQNDVNVREER